MADRDVAARVAEFLLHYEERFTAVQHEFPRPFTPAETKLRKQCLDLLTIDSCERAGRVPRKRADEARAQVLNGVSLSERPLELSDTPASIRARDRDRIGAARFRAAVDRANRSAPRRALLPRQRPRERRAPRRTVRTAAVGSRGDPSPDDDDPDLAARIPDPRRPAVMRRLPRPTPAATPLQRACILLAEAIRAASEDSRAYRAFVEILCTRAATEAERLLDRERRP